MNSFSLSVMLRLESVEGGMISGVNGEELDFLTMLTNSNTDAIFDQWTGLPEGEASLLNELLDENIEHIEIPEVSNKTFLDLDENVNEELNKLEEQEIPNTTRAQTLSYARKFKIFLQSKSLPDCIETMPVRYLNQYLRFWYSSLRKPDGSFYSPSTLACIRAGVNRYLSKTPCNRPINLKVDRDFVSANNMLKTMASKYLKSNESAIDNGYKALTDTDLRKLQSYFTRDTPTKLQQEVFFTLIYYKGYRGREWMRNIDKNHLKFKRDEQQAEYVDVEIPIFSKNCKGSLEEKNYSNSKQTRIYATGEEIHCPVAALKLYVSKIPPNVNILFPAPCRKWKFSDKFWYAQKQVVGKNMLASMMKTISADAGLSSVYTNHCLRATCVTQLHNKGFSVSDIQTVTGHKRPDSVQRYIKQIGSEKKRKLSHALCESMNPTMTESTSIVQSESVSISKNEMTSDYFSRCMFSNCTINISK